MNFFEQGKRKVWKQRRKVMLRPWGSSHRVGGKNSRSGRTSRVPAPGMETEVIKAIKQARSMELQGLLRMLS